MSVFPLNDCDFDRNKAKANSRAWLCWVKKKNLVNIYRLKTRSVKFEIQLYCNIKQFQHFFLFSQQFFTLYHTLWLQFVNYWIWSHFLKCQILISVCISRLQWHAQFLQHSAFCLLDQEKNRVYCWRSSRFFLYM